MHDPFPFDFEISTFGGGFPSVDGLEETISSGRLRAAVDATPATFSNKTWALSETNLGQFSLYSMPRMKYR